MRSGIVVLWKAISEQGISHRSAVLHALLVGYIHVVLSVTAALLFSVMTSSEDAGLLGGALLLPGRAAAWLLGLAGTEISGEAPPSC